MKCNCYGGVVLSSVMLTFIGVEVVMEVNLIWESNIQALLFTMLPNERFVSYHS